MEVSGQLHVPAASRPGKNAGAHWKGSRVGARVVLDALEEEKTVAATPERRL
jgi:hypothetical protein